MCIGEPNNINHLCEREVGSLRRKLLGHSCLKISQNQEMSMTITDITMRTKAVPERYLCGVYHRVHKRQNSSRTSRLLVSQYSKYTFTREGSKVDAYLSYANIDRRSITTSNQSISFMWGIVGQNMLFW